MEAANLFENENVGALLEERVRGSEAREARSYDDDLRLPRHWFRQSRVAFGFARETRSEWGETWMDLGTMSGAVACSGR